MTEPQTLYRSLCAESNLHPQKRILSDIEHLNTLGAKFAQTPETTSLDYQAPASYIGPAHVLIFLRVLERFPMLSWPIRKLCIDVPDLGAIMLLRELLASSTDAGKRYLVMLRELHVDARRGIIGAGPALLKIVRTFPRITSFKTSCIICCDNQSFVDACAAQAEVNAASMTHSSVATAEEATTVAVAVSPSRQRKTPKKPSSAQQEPAAAAADRRLELDGEEPQHTAGTQTSDTTTTLAAAAQRRNEKITSATFYSGAPLCWTRRFAARSTEDQLGDDIRLRQLQNKKSRSNKTKFKSESACGSGIFVGSPMIEIDPECGIFDNEAEAIAAFERVVSTHNAGTTFEDPAFPKKVMLSGCLFCHGGGGGGALGDGGEAAAAPLDRDDDDGCDDENKKDEDVLLHDPSEFVSLHRVFNPAPSVFGSTGHAVQRVPAIMDRPQHEQQQQQHQPPLMLLANHNATSSAAVAVVPESAEDIPHSFPHRNNSLVLTSLLETSPSVPRSIGRHRVVPDNNDSSDHHFSPVDAPPVFSEPPSNLFGPATSIESGKLVADRYLAQAISVAVSSNANEVLSELFVRSEPRAGAVLLALHCPVRGKKIYVLIDDRVPFMVDEERIRAANAVGNNNNNNNNSGNGRSPLPRGRFSITSMSSSFRIFSSDPSMIAAPLLQSGSPMMPPPRSVPQLCMLRRNNTVAQQLQTGTSAMFQQYANTLYEAAKTCPWVPLIEKAFAKIYGGYAGLAKGNFQTALETLLGGSCAEWAFPDFSAFASTSSSNSSSAAVPTPKKGTSAQVYESFDFLGSKLLHPNATHSARGSLVVARAETDTPEAARSLAERGLSPEEIFLLERCFEIEDNICAKFDLSSANNNNNNNRDASATEEVAQQVCRGKQKYHLLRLRSVDPRLHLTANLKRSLFSAGTLLHQRWAARLGCAPVLTERDPTDAPSRRASLSRGPGSFRSGMFSNPRSPGSFRMQQQQQQQQQQHQQAGQRSSLFSAGSSSGLSIPAPDQSLITVSSPDSASPTRPDISFSSEQPSDQPASALLDACRETSFSPSSFVSDRRSSIDQMPSLKVQDAFLVTAEDFFVTFRSVTVLSFMHQSPSEIFFETIPLKIKVSSRDAAICDELSGRKAPPLPQQKKHSSTRNNKASSSSEHSLLLTAPPSSSSPSSPDRHPRHHHHHHETTATPSDETAAPAVAARKNNNSSNNRSTLPVSRSMPLLLRRRSHTTWVESPAFIIRNVAGKHTVRLVAGTMHHISLVRHHLGKQQSGSGHHHHHHHHHHRVGLQMSVLSLKENPASGDATVNNFLSPRHTAQTLKEHQVPRQFAWDLQEDLLFETPVVFDGPCTLDMKLDPRAAKRNSCFYVVVSACVVDDDDASDDSESDDEHDDKSAPSSCPTSSADLFVQCWLDGAATASSEEVVIQRVNDKVKKVASPEWPLDPTLSPCLELDEVGYPTADDDNNKNKKSNSASSLSSSSLSSSLSPSTLCFSSSLPSLSPRIFRNTIISGRAFRKWELGMFPQFLIRFSHLPIPPRAIPPPPRSRRGSAQAASMNSGGGESPGGRTPLHTPTNTVKPSFADIPSVLHYSSPNSAGGDGSPFANFAGDDELQSRLHEVAVSVVLQAPHLQGLPLQSMIGCAVFQLTEVKTIHHDGCRYETFADLAKDCVVTANTPTATTSGGGGGSGNKEISASNNTTTSNHHWASDLKLIDGISCLFHKHAPGPAIAVRIPVAPPPVVMTHSQYYHYQHHHHHHHHHHHGRNAFHSSTLSQGVTTPESPSTPTGKAQGDGGAPSPFLSAISGGGTSSAIGRQQQQQGGGGGMMGNSSTASNRSALSFDEPPMSTTAAAAAAAASSSPSSSQFVSKSFLVVPSFMGECVDGYSDNVLAAAAAAMMSSEVLLSMTATVYARNALNISVTPLLERR